MKNAPAILISILFHPLFFTLYSFLLVFFLPGYMDMLPYSYKKTVILVFSLTSVLAPIIFLILLRLLGVIESVTLEKQKDRNFPLVIAFIFYVTGYILAVRFPADLPQMVFSILFVAGLSALVALFINIKLKFSLHMLTIGCFASLFLSHYFLFQVDVMWFSILIILAAGIIAGARLKLHAHRPPEIYAGLIAGLLLGMSPSWLITLGWIL
ncbi:MAG: hypothetical protein U9N85_11240 [Bacteroidota bacterium]|nr:hypothetical protein [Bacteroidota bacterium]